MDGETKYLQNAVSFDYWQYVYFVNHCFYFNHELYKKAESIYNDLLIFDKYIKSEADKVDFFHIEGILASYLSIKLGVDPITPLPNLNIEEMYILENLLAFCIKYSYYPWTIVAEINSFAILEFLVKEKKIPPTPKKFTLSDNDLYALINQMYYRGVDYQGNIERTKEFSAAHDIVITANPSKKEQNLNKLKQKLELQWESRNSLFELIEKGKVKDVSKIEEFSKIRKSYEEHHFLANSNISRAIGLILLEKKYEEIKIEERKSNAEVTEWFNKEFHELFVENETLWDKLNNQTVVDRWIRKTE